VNVTNRISDAIAFHIEGLAAEGMALPEPQAFSAYGEVPPS